MNFFKLNSEIGDFFITKVALVTGSSGFIGFHLSKLLLSLNWKIVGLDSMNDYYDVKIKKDRLEILNKHINFHNYKGLVENDKLLDDIFFKHKPSIIVHLAGQAGVRYSIDNPSSHVQSNLVGTFQILEMARKYNPVHLLIASTSSVYGNNKNLPLDEKQKTDTPISFYAATKKSIEVMAHSYSHLFNIPTTIFRFFTVYGPWGRPDMAPMLFAKAILSGQPIRVFNNGQMQRDFTYIDDIVEGVVRVMRKPAEVNSEFNKNQPDPATSWAPHRVFNIGNSNPIPLMEFIGCLEESLGVEAIKQFEPMQPGDVKATAADTAALYEWVGFKPSTPIDAGVKAFARWYRSYYKLT